MHALIVLAHPEQKSFNAQLARLCMEELRHQEYTVETSDLYRMDFDPERPPARTCVGVAQLIGGSRVEIDCIARLRP